MPAPKTLVGYTGTIAARPGDRLPVMVSSENPYSACVVDVRNADDVPQAAGEREASLPWLPELRRDGRVQPIELGSYGIAPASANLDTPRILTFASWVFVTLARAQWRALIARWRSSKASAVGYGLFLAPEGDAGIRIATRNGAVDVRSQAPMQLRTWYLVVGMIDFERGIAELHQVPRGSQGSVAIAASVRKSIGRLEPAAHGIPFTLAAHFGPAPMRGHFDGKLDRPSVFNSEQPPDALMGRLADDFGTEDDVVAAWDFSRDMASTRVRDRSANDIELVLVNMPTRAVTGHNWRGTEDCWRHAPSEYAAVHFHSDDLEDAGWDSDFEVAVPADADDGVYAVRLTSATGEVDRVPFIVRSCRPRHDIAVVLPTFTYLAYANERITSDFEVLSESPEDGYVTVSGMLSQYNKHADQSGVMYASERRPLLNLRPSHRYWLTANPHGLAADLHLLSWLRHAGFRHDLLTDRDIHAGGEDLLAQYRVVLTGGHPEYITLSEMCAFRSYVHNGGRLMYLGGNGFNMVIGVHPEHPHVTEIRRTGSAGGLWQGNPGEFYLGTTGELGGQWTFRRERGRELVGVDIVGMGFGPARPYERTAESYDARAAFVFDGVGPDQPIGDAGLVLGGAAGYEVDGFDRSLGSPEHGIVLATARGFSAGYAPMSADPDVRADMVLIETPNGGAVFSVGSIAWCGALPVDGFDNNVARITSNVLRRFAGRD